MKSNFSFELLATDGDARAGIFHTPHGDIPTPIFAPVGTQATVKALTPAQVKDTGASLILANTYHLFLRPGAELVAEMGGLHSFMQWNQPILTDSGGFQVFSLADMRKVDEDGVTFKSHIDGSMQRMTPESSIAVQEQLGADIIMAFDECAPPYDRDYITLAMQRTHRWAESCVTAQTRSDQALFGIVQGGIFADLRHQSAEYIASLNLPGNAIGGLSVGETKAEMAAMLEIVNPVLPADKPRYLMGVGAPEDLVEGIQRGVDIFDCVLPTRLARHQSAMTLTGRMNMLNAAYIHDKNPIDEMCPCYACQNFSRAYIRHLIVSREMLASTLLSIHNITTLLRLVQSARQAIIEHRYGQFAVEFHKNYNPSKTNIGEERMTFLQAVILGIIQGITEFLPISSSAHLVLTPFFLNWQLDEQVVFPFDVLVQLGTLLAVLIYFWKDIWNILTGLWKAVRTRTLKDNDSARLGLWVVLATIPAGILGMLFKDQVEAAFHSPLAVGIFLLVTAFLLLAAEGLGKRTRSLKEMNALDAILIGMAQALSIFPGVSRSGSTISAGMLRHLERPAAARFSFLMSIPIFLAAGVLSVGDLLEIPDLAGFLPVLAAGFIAAAVVGYLSIRWLLAFLQKHSFKGFAVYCVLLGVITIGVYALR